MDRITLVFALSLLTLAGCSSTENTCEDITVTKEQIQQCQSLQRQIAQKKQSPLIRTELERRYEQDCVNVRYYRDDQQADVCGSDNKVLPSANAISQEK